MRELLVECVEYFAERMEIDETDEKFRCNVEARLYTELTNYLNDEKYMRILEAAPSMYVALKFVVERTKDVSRSSHEVARKALKEIDDDI